MKAKQRKRRVLLGLAAYAFIAAAVCLTIYSQRPPAVVDAGAPATEFSAARALEHLKAIAARPHPVGSAEQENVRRHILSGLRAAGIEPEVQKAALVEEVRGGAVGASLQNIVARVPGTEPGGKAILLTAHYDSVPNSPGASDDGSGVVVLLETLRALKAGPPLKRDVIALFDEGEEIGLLGAKSFVAESPHAKQVGLVLNFEARGSRGPVFMFETSEGNGWLIGEFAKAAPHPFASSLMYSIYKLLPNDTDLSVFKKAGLPGYNFAFIGGIAHYHSRRDDLESIDVRSIQHGGSYALPLVRHLGNLDLGATQAPDAVYFDVLGAALVSYPGGWARPLAVGLVVLFAVVVVLGLRRGELTLKGVLFGFLLTLLAITVSVLAVTFILEVLFNVRGGFSPLRNASLFLVSFVCIAVAVSSTLALALNRWVGFNDLSFGGLALWLVLAVALGFLLPGASYLFQWPLFFALAAAGVTFLLKEREPLSAGALAVTCLGVLPGLVLLTGSTYNIFQGVMLAMLPPLMLLVMLSLVGLVPLLKYLAAPYRWNLSLLAFVAGLACLMIGMALPINDKSTPRKHSVQYSLNTDRKEAVWVSTDRGRDEWAAQFLTEAAEQKPLPDHFPGFDRKFLVDKAPVLDLGADHAEVLSDRTEGGVRRLALRLTSTRSPREFEARFGPNVQVLSAVVNGKRLDYRDDVPQRDGGGKPAAWALTYSGLPPEGIELSLELTPAEPATLVIMSLTDGLPEIAGKTYKPRPDTLIPAPWSDNSRVLSTFNLGAGGL
ncbi:MAG TPA: M20/M25/M40 family metallo-hydrolase [Pyrinomonadaceae bacterium]|jgi:hypothetical protein